MEELQELLSLANFEPDKAYEPYLNTPRSLEACRMNGVNPIELVEIPISEFQKDFPNDPDAVQRRFERVDGARRRMLAYVMRDWKQLCASGWQPPKERPQSAKETIIHVSAGAHCTLLEQQAQRFRKIEADNWEALNRQLKMELRQAEIEQRNKKITQKHEEIQNQNDNTKKERQEMVQRLHKEEMERLKKKQEDEAAEIRRLQALDSEAARLKMAQDEENRLREKQARERRELERVQREQYTKQLKNSIMTGLENQVEAKKKVLAIRDKNMEDRVEQTRREREQMLERRRLEKEQRLAKAREDQQKQDDEERAEMLERIARNEEKRRRLWEQREWERKEMLEKNEDFTREKLAKIRETSDGVVNGKAARTLQTMEMKEKLARQELQHVKEAQDKRRCIKAIRQEAFKMAAHRARKAEEYRLMKVAADLKNKDDRCAAIKQGFRALDVMRNSMKDIMEKTTNELKHEMHQLRHKDAFSPEKVVTKALEVGNHVLFPRLERTFGIAQSPFARAGSATLLGGGANLFPSEFAGTAGTTSGRARTVGESLFGPADDFMPTADTALRASAGATNAGTSAALAATATAEHGGTHHHGAAGKHSSSRLGFDPLPIQVMTQDRLQATLAASKSRLADSQGSKGGAGKGTSAKGKGLLDDFGAQDRFAFDGDEEDDSPYPSSAPPAILKLDEPGSRRAGSPLGPDSKGRQQSRSRGLEISLSPTASQDSVSVGHFLPATPTPSKPQPESEPSPDAAARPSSSKQRVRSSKKNGVTRSSAEDVKLPMFKFDPKLEDGQAVGDQQVQEQAAAANSGSAKAAERVPPSPMAVDTSQKSGKESAPSPGPVSLSKKFSSSFGKEIRTDVNEKATFLEPPPGKFRREFSNDHPLAKGGTGKYLKELKKGVTPAGMHVEVPEHLKRTNSSVAETVGVANKIERLTYTAQKRVVDPKSQIDELKRQQNEALKRIIVEEREAEAVREQALRSVSDPRERQNLEGVFSEERRRASDRIIEATRQHEEAMKAAVLAMMDLGVGGLNYGKDDTRLPMGNFFQ